MTLMGHAAHPDPRHPREADTMPKFTLLLTALLAASPVLAAPAGVAPAL
jgi:hypothetical protein